MSDPIGRRIDELTEQMAAQEPLFSDPYFRMGVDLAGASVDQTTVNTMNWTAEDMSSLASSILARYREEGPLVLPPAAMIIPLPEEPHMVPIRCHDLLDEGNQISHGDLVVLPGGQVGFVAAPPDGEGFMQVTTEGFPHREGPSPRYVAEGETFMAGPYMFRAGAEVGALVRRVELIGASAEGSPSQPPPSEYRVGVSEQGLRVIPAYSGDPNTNPPQEQIVYETPPPRENNFTPVRRPTMRREEEVAREELRPTQAMAVAAAESVQRWGETGLMSAADMLAIFAQYGLPVTTAEVMDRDAMTRLLHRWLGHVCHNTRIDEVVNEPPRGTRIGHIRLPLPAGGYVEYERRLYSDGREGHDIPDPRARAYYEIIGNNIQWRRRSVPLREPPGEWAVQGLPGTVGPVGHQGIPGPPGPRIPRGFRSTGDQDL